ncbi:ATP-dependent Clp protease proteolytic subunit [Polaribacter undariae]|uniref:ATP-dependent Clp protease proteolytic subunit n=1 Tax=Polaribacter sejongensis TaxID=985043 RepID=A0AAJ1VIK0_9FLAO|nr:ATP-dependent Clp protease proteolytic subunit [Polaribacter undariae]MDN3621339.1 ATP-dependent Clp protease proteolytic subunit [Polaribacter undariae]UWD31881.1 ATP-dependent Clp protease proteolytic subunit [Polaribacter undariae]
MEHKDIFKVVNGAKKPTISMIGYVGSYRVNSEVLQNAITQMEKDNVTDCDILINSGGGSTIEGLTIGDLMTNSSIKFHGIVIGMAASMAGSILQFCETRSAYKNARIMIHKVQGGAHGESDSLRSMADLIDQEEFKITDQFVLRTGKTIEIVKSWMKPGVNKWFTSKDALKNNLIDNIIQSDKKIENSIDNSITNELELVNAYIPFVDEILNVKNKNEDRNIMNKSEIIALLVANGLAGTLTENSTDNDVSGMLTQVVADAKLANQYKTDLDNHKKTQAETLVNQAVKDGKLTATEKEAWTTDAIANFKVVATAINRMVGKQNPANGIEVPAPRNEGDADAHKLFKGREAWNFAKWQDEAPEDLATIESEAFDQFEELFNKSNI